MIFKYVEKTKQSIFCGHRHPKRESREKIILRERVLKIVDASKVPLTGREIAARAGLQYKQTIDALDALYNHGRVHRHGKKLKTRWCAIVSDQRGVFLYLDRAFNKMTAARSNCRRLNKLR